LVKFSDARPSCQPQARLRWNLLLDFPHCREFFGMLSLILTSLNGALKCSSLRTPRFSFFLRVCRTSRNHGIFIRRCNFSQASCYTEWVTFHSVSLHWSNPPKLDAPSSALQQPRYRFDASLMCLMEPIIVIWTWVFSRSNRHVCVSGTPRVRKRHWHTYLRFWSCHQHYSPSYPLTTLPHNCRP
jgi:hypothetical protein